MPVDSLYHRKVVSVRLLSYDIKMHIRANDAQLAERKILFRRPLARRDCANAQSIFVT